MPFDGSGTFNRVMNWVNDAASGIKIRADRHDQEDNNLAAGLSMCLTKDGQTTPTADIKLGGRRLINVGDPTADQDAVTKAWVNANLVGGALIADAPPAAGKVGNLWWDSDQGGLYLRYDDGTSVQWVQVNVGDPLAMEPQDGFIYGRRNGAWTKALGSNSPYIAFAGGGTKDVSLPTAWDQLNLAFVSMTNATASAYFYAQLLTGGTPGAPGDPLVGGTPVAGTVYNGCLSSVTTAAGSSAWASNIPFGGAAAINTPHSGRCTLRAVGTSWVEVDAQVSYSAGNGTNLSTGFLTVNPATITGIRLGMTSGNFTSGVVRMFWQ